MLDELKIEIEKLFPEETSELIHWLSELEWKNWDRQIEADSRAGKLDFLVREAFEEKSKGSLVEISQIYR